MPDYIIAQRKYNFSSFNWADSVAWNLGKIDGTCYTAGVNTYYYGGKKETPIDRNNRTVIDLSDFVKGSPPIPPYPQGSYYWYKAYVGYNYSYASWTPRGSVYSKFTLYFDYIFQGYEMQDIKVWEFIKKFVYNTYYPAENFNGESGPITIYSDTKGVRINFLCDTEIPYPESQFIAYVCYLQFVKYLYTPEPLSFNFGFFIPQKRNF